MLKVPMIDKPVLLKVELFLESTSCLLYFLVYLDNNYIEMVLLLKLRNKMLIFLKVITNILEIYGLKEA